MCKFKELLMGINISLVFDFLSLCLTFFLAYVAWRALNTWKWQISHQNIYDEALKLEKSIVRYLILTMEEKSVIGNIEVTEVNQSIQDSRFWLLMREFEKTKLESIEKCMRNTFNDIKNNSGVVSKINHEKLLDALNDFSDSINTSYLLNSSSKCNT